MSCGKKGQWWVVKQRGFWAWTLKNKLRRQAKPWEGESYPLVSRLLVSMFLGKIRNPGSKPTLREKESLGPARKSGSRVSITAHQLLWRAVCCFPRVTGWWTSSGTDDDPDQRTSQRGHPEGVRGREGNRTGACNEPQEVEFTPSRTGYRDMW